MLRKFGLKCECASPHWLHPYSHGVAGYRCRLRKPLLHDTVAEDTQRPAAIRGVPYPICDPSPCHRRRFRQYCGECIIYSRSLTSQIHSAAIVSLYLRGWTRWGEIALLRHGFYAMAWGEEWGRHLSSDAGIDSSNEVSVQKQSAFFVQDQDPKVHASPRPLPSIRGHPADSAPRRQQTRRSDHPYDENTRRADHDPRGILGTTTDAPSPGSLGFVVLSLPTDGQACAGGDRGQWRECHA